MVFFGSTYFFSIVRRFCQQNGNEDSFASQFVSNLVSRMDASVGYSAIFNELRMVEFLARKPFSGAKPTQARGGGRGVGCGNKRLNYLFLW
jgi:hypothetical protein